MQDALVREELDRVLASHEFQASKLCQRFLRYVVENTLNRNTDSLKERTIGIEVFGKPPSYDPSEDAGVRVKAGEVRKRLRSYYLNRPAEVKVVIDLPPGTYVPEFHPFTSPERLVRAKSWLHSWLSWTVLGTILLAVALTASLWLR